MRIDEIAENNKKLPKQYRMTTEEGRQLAMISVLTDISETLAIFTDVYANIYGRMISRKEPDNASKQ